MCRSGFGNIIVLGRMRQRTCNIDNMAHNGMMDEYTKPYSVQIWYLIFKNEQYWLLVLTSDGEFTMAVWKAALIAPAS